MSAERYYQTYGVLEVQQTFYQPPDINTMRRWRASAPEGFEFTIKAWQLITHRATSSTYRRLRMPLTDAQKNDAGGFRTTPVVLDAWKTTVDCAKTLQATAILFQCPASFRPIDENIENMRRFFGEIKRPRRVNLLWEPRGEWPDELIIELCRDLHLIHAVDPFVRPSLTPALTYWRLHGITGSRHVYSDEELQQLAAWLPDSGDTYVMFNNMPRIGDAERFRKLVERNRSAARS